jgi:porphobilinogen synthase
MAFPTTRARRLRASAPLRRLVTETRLAVADLVYPLFAVPGTGVREQIGAMPGNYHLSVDALVEETRRVADLGIPAVLLFGIPEAKDEVGSGAYAADGIVQRAVRAIREADLSLLVISDVCLCEYTSHGHCGAIRDGDVDNDATLDLLARTAVTQADAGADIVAPSDMMDGRVAAIRAALDAEGHEAVAIMSYAAKYASAFYGPFRDAADSTPLFGDRRTYQMDPPNVREALKEIELDIAEGADIVMVKPALAYLDVIAKAREAFNVPLACYNVSGEYAMVKAAGRAGWLDEQRVAMEMLTAMKRAGADILITYFAKDAVDWLAD